MTGHAYIPKRYNGARDTTFARSARNNCILKRYTYYLRDATRNYLPRAEVLSNKTATRCRISIPRSKALDNYRPRNLTRGLIPSPPTHSRPASGARHWTNALDFRIFPTEFRSHKRPSFRTLLFYFLTFPYLSYISLHFHNRRWPFVCLSCETLQMEIYIKSVRPVRWKRTAETYRDV